MTKAPALDLKRLQNRAFDRAEWAEEALRYYHATAKKCGAAAVRPLQTLYEWMFVPPTLWPFNLQEVLENCLANLEKKKSLTVQQRLLIDLLPEPPDETICAAAADHEWRIQKGTYENLLKAQAKYAQNELAIKSHPQLRRQWERIKAVFNIKTYCDYKGVIRRTMTAERNLRPSFTVNMRRRADVFQAVFDAFCLRWNLYGMQHDEPLPLKLAVHLTPYGTMIHIPAYWSFDPKRDIRWDAIAKLHRTRVPKRQGSALAEGLAERLKLAEILRDLDQEVRRCGLRGAKRHEFLCAGLGWDSRTSPKRISRLRAEFI
jgi:hypothetical protein